MTCDGHGATSHGLRGPETPEAHSRLPTPDMHMPHDLGMRGRQTWHGKQGDATHEHATHAHATHDMPHHTCTPHAISFTIQPAKHIEAEKKTPWAGELKQTRRANTTCKQDVETVSRQQDMHIQQATEIEQHCKHVQIATCISSEQHMHTAPQHTPAAQAQAERVARQARGLRASNTSTYATSEQHLYIHMMQIPRYPHQNTHQPAM